jgi:hypothetical protein
MAQPAQYWRAEASERSELRVIEAGYTDTEGTTSLWTPDLGPIVAGDVA